MAVPTFKKIRMVPEASGTSKEVETPVEATAGQTLMIAIAVSEAGLPIAIAGGGWTKQLLTNFNNETVAIYTLPNWNGSTTKYKVEWGGASHFWVGLIASYGGTDTSTPVNVVGEVKTGETANPTVKGVTTTSAENLLIAFEFNQGGVLSAPETGWTEDGDQAGGPELSHKNEGVAAGAQAEITLTMTAKKWFTVMLSLQPPIVITPPTVTTLAAASVAKTTATLKGEVNPNSSTTKYWWEYGTTEAFGSKTAEEEGGSGGVAVAKEKGITGLTSGTKYFFRMVASNAGGTTNGTILNFTTEVEPVAPVNTVAPVISGTTKVGSTLFTTNGSWTGTPAPSFTYTWERSPNGSTEWAVIAAATASSYPLVKADEAKFVRSVVKATNEAGNASKASAASALIGAEESIVVITPPIFTPIAGFESPRQPTRCAVQVYPPGSDTITIGPDELEAEDIPVAITWATELPGGFGPADITMPLPPGIPSPKTWLNGGTRIFDADTDTTYHEGRIVNVSSDTASATVSLSIEGWSKHLYDDNTAAEIFIDRDLSGWGNQSLEREAVGIASETFRWTAMDTNIGFSDAGSTNTYGIYHILKEHLAGTVSNAETWYYGNNIDIETVTYDFVAPHPGGTEGLANFCAVAEDDKNTGSVSGTNHVATPASNQSVPNTAAGKKYCYYRTFFNGATTGRFADDMYGMKNLAVHGRHSLTKQGNTAAGYGYLVSDMTVYVMTKWAPLLSYSTGPEGSIESTSFPVPHSVFNEDTTAAAMIEAWVLFGGANDEPLQWGVYEAKRFFMREPRSFGRTWRVRQDQTAESSDQGFDSSQRINGVKVIYDRGDGHMRSIGPIGSRSTTETVDLEDKNPSNPANADGARHWLVYQAGVMNEEQAKLVAGLVLTQTGSERWKGTITVEGWVMDSSSVIWPAAMMRSGDWAIVEDDDSGDTAPRSVRNTSYDVSSKINSCSVGAPPDELSVLLAQAGISLVGKL